ncbi:putative beta-hexosaminidase [Saccostrea cucullata]|uniref:putative beta-hexosaminidase n=1 Tax=Saccostrea cuccullata TaxID=36930 RepID=UPI002ED19026
MWKLSVGGLVGIILCFQYAHSQVAKTIARDLDIKYAVRTNFAMVGRAPHSVAELTLTNTGNTALPETGYSLFFCHDNFLFPVSYQEDLAKYEAAPYGGPLIIEGYDVNFLHGCMYEFKAVGAGLQPKESKNITLYFQPFTVSRYDSFRNWYVRDNANNIEVLPDTVNLDYVGDFKTPLNQLRRTDDLQSVPKEPQDRQNAYVPFMSGVLYDVTPKPREQTVNQPVNLIDVTAAKGGWKIAATDPTLDTARDYLASQTKIKTATAAPANPKTIELNLKPASYFPTQVYGPVTDEAYELKITPNKIEINGASPKGVINGIHTFISQQAWREVPEQIIRDGPRFPERALHLDIASNFYQPAEIKKVIDLMALYKLNRLYLQLWNNHGLRLDMGLGAAQIAGKRCHDPKEEMCLFTQLGSNPDGSGLGNGYLTPTQFKNLIEYADDRGVMIVPSVNVGDNARAMVVGMEGAIKSGKQGISLFDPTDEDLRISGRYPGKDTAINPCRPETMQFVNYVLKSLKRIYSQAGIPLSRLHFGSDFNTEQMMTSKHCFPIAPRNATELQAARSKLTAIKADFLAQLGALFTRENVDISGTVDFFTGFPDNEFVSRMTIMDKSKRYPNISAFAINDDYMRFNPPAGPNSRMEIYANRAQLLKNNGYKVLVSPPHKTKFDTAYEPDPNAPGDYSVATRNVSLREAFAWVPNSRCCNLNLAPEQVANEVTKHGCLASTLCDPFADGITSFDGTMATIDTRKLPNINTTLQLLTPRLFSFAERSWHEAPWEASFTAATPYQPPQAQNQAMVPPLDVSPTLNPDFTGLEEDYQRFRSIIGAKEVMRVASKGIPVFCSAPGARVVRQPTGDKLETSCMYPNMKVYVKNNMGEFEEMKTIPTTNVTIKCQYYLPSFRRFFECYEQEFNSNLDKTPYEHVYDHIQQRAEAMRREQEALRIRNQQNIMEMARRQAAQQAAFLQRQQQQGGGQQGGAGQLPGAAQLAGAGQQGRGQGGARRQGAGQRGAGQAGRGAQQRRQAGR